MRYEVEQDEGTVEIQIDGVGDHTPTLLRAFQECQTGNCTCPTDQYDRLATMHVGQAEDQLTLRLTAEEGQQFDVNELKMCLEHTISKALEHGDT